MKNIVETLYAAVRPQDRPEGRPRPLTDEFENHLMAATAALS